MSSFFGGGGGGRKTHKEKKTRVYKMYSVVNNYSFPFMRKNMNQNFFPTIDIASLNCL